MRVRSDVVPVPMDLRRAAPAAIIAGRSAAITRVPMTKWSLASTGVKQSFDRGSTCVWARTGRRTRTVAAAGDHRSADAAPGLVAPGRDAAGADRLGTGQRTAGVVRVERRAGVGTMRGGAGPSVRG